MKKLILTFLIVTLSQSINAITIENITVSPISNEAINIHLGTMEGSCFYYDSFQYNITGNTITINVCFAPQLCNAVTHLENDFQIPIDNTVINNFTLIINTYYVSIPSFVCNYQTLEDSETVTLSTPLDATVVLSAIDFNSKTYNLAIYPNPTNGILEIRDNNAKFNTIKIFDDLGRQVKVYFNNEKSIDLKELVDGIYVIELNSDKEKISRKIVLKK